MLVNTFPGKNRASKQGESTSLSSEKVFSFPCNSQDTCYHGHGFTAVKEYGNVVWLKTIKISQGLEGTFAVDFQLYIPITKGNFHLNTVVYVFCLITTTEYKKYGKFNQLSV